MRYDTNLFPKWSKHKYTHYHASLTFDVNVTVSFFVPFSFFVLSIMPASAEITPVCSGTSHYVLHLH